MLEHNIEQLEAEMLDWIDEVWEQNIRDADGKLVIYHTPLGSYLCIVPDRWGKSHKDLFLPFADAEDDKVSEVISKVLLLINDNKIKDQSILRQIKRQMDS